MVCTRFYKGLFFVLFIFLATGAFAQSDAGDKQRWINDTYNKLNTEERIGQLFMVAAYSGGKDYNEAGITDLINKHQIGGLIFMQGDPASQAE